ncbi:hypothetical protein DW723_03755 [Blautia obeum]|uniref:Uncharacterized protein n=1 Tax=Blautia obeum TaxID=40520 RepID=A0A414KL06_9FIRM|nr:hypothetical protein DW723_03755 [Blautia obeum]
MKKEFEKEQSDNQIDDAFLDMPDMEDDEKFRQWLEEEYLKEADAIEESLFDGRKFEDNQDIVEKLSVSRESFYQRAREEGLLEDTQMRRQKMRRIQKKQCLNLRKRKFWNSEKTQVYQRILHAMRIETPAKGNTVMCALAESPESQACA